jgi:hypothetical protein
MAGVEEEAFAGKGIPNLDDGVFAARSDARSVRRPGHAVDCNSLIRVGEETPACMDRQDLDGIV